MSGHPRDAGAWWASLVRDGWWVGDGLRDGRPSDRLLAWVHERRRLHRAPQETCPSCLEYRERWGDPPGDQIFQTGRRWLLRRDREAARTRQPHIRKLRSEVKGALWWEILERDDFRCRHCGVRRFLTVDHIVPLDKGGTNDRENLQTLCRSCNSSKGNR